MGECRPDIEKDTSNGYRYSYRYRYRYRYTGAILVLGWHAARATSVRSYIETIRRKLINCRVLIGITVIAHHHWPQKSKNV